MFLLAALTLAGCGSSVLATRGETQVAPLLPTELAQSDVNRMATLGMRDNLDSLLRIADKLYRRNPGAAPATPAVKRPWRNCAKPSTAQRPGPNCRASATSRRCRWR